MKCPTCNADMLPLARYRPDPVFWCPECGTLNFEGSNSNVPAQAKSHAALQEALERIANMAHLAWTDPVTVRASFECLERRATLALDGK